MEEKVSGCFGGEDAAGFAGEIERGAVEALPQVGLRGVRAFGGDARDVAIGLVELAHDLVVVDGIGIAGQHGEDFAEAWSAGCAARRSGGW